MCVWGPVINEENHAKRHDTAKRRRSSVVGRWGHTIFPIRSRVGVRSLARVGGKSLEKVRKRDLFLKTLHYYAHATTSKQNSVQVFGRSRRFRGSSLIVWGRNFKNIILKKSIIRVKCVTVRVSRIIMEPY